MSAATDINVETELGLIKCLLSVAADMACELLPNVAPGAERVDQLSSLIIVARERADALDEAYASIIREGAVPCS